MRHDEASKERKMKNRILSVAQTYSEVTPASASEGDFSETGFEIDQRQDYTLKDIIRLIEDQGVESITSHGSSLDVYGYFYTSCHRTATERQTCVHIEGPARAIKRLERILKGMR